MLMRMYWRRHYGALQHVDAMVCDALTYNRIRRGQKSLFEGGEFECDMSSVLLGDVLCDEVFACCCECALGA